MFLGCLQDFSRMFLACSDGSCGPGGIWCSFQMKVGTLMIQRNSMIPRYSMIPAIRWSPANRWSPTIRWSQQLLFDDPQVFDDQLEVWTLIIKKSTVIPPSLMVLFIFVHKNVYRIRILQNNLFPYLLLSWVVSSIPNTIIITIYSLNSYDYRYLVYNDKEGRDPDLIRQPEDRGFN